jgi:putative copper resistance protein D
MTLILFLVVARWIHFVAMFLLFGIPVFWLWEGASCDPKDLPQTFGRGVILLRAATAFAIVSGVVWLAGILATIGGGFDDLGDLQTWRLFFFNTQFGGVSALRLALLVLLAVIVFIPSKHRARPLPLIVISGLLLVSQAWLGHAAEGGAGLYGDAMILTYGAHVLAGSAWVGGLAPLVLALSELRSSRPYDAAARALRMLSRYSLMGMGAVTLIVASGIANAAFRVGGDFDRLVMTTYGAVLGAKLFMVAVMLGLAYFNRFVAMPRLRDFTAHNGPAAKGMPLAAGLCVSIAAEWGVGLLVLGIAALLGITPPPQ